MQVVVIADPAHVKVVRHDIQTLHFQTRGRWMAREGEDFDGRIVLTIDFRYSLDADNFRRSRNIAPYISSR